MMMKISILLLVIVLTSSIVNGYKFFGGQGWSDPKEEVNADDHCFPYTTCETCIAQPFCGWCSTPVIGGNGAQCAGFSPTNGSSPFICVGTYQTTTCIVPTTASSQTSTASTGSTGTHSTSTGTTGTTGTTGPQPKPVVAGTWRGLQINSGYVAGEWTFTFLGDNATIIGPNNWRASGTILSSVTEMDIVIIESSATDLVGKTLYGIYEQDFGPACLFLTWGVGPSTSRVPPANWGAAMKDITGKVWAMEQPKAFLWE